MKDLQISEGEFSARVGEIILRLPYLVSQSRHESVKDYLYYIDPGIMEGRVLEWQFVKDLFTMPTPKVAERWPTLIEFHSLEMMKKVEWL